MLTIFTVRKPFLGHIGRIQLARNWTSLWPRLDPGAIRVELSEQHRCYGVMTSRCEADGDGPQPVCLNSG